MRSSSVKTCMLIAATCFFGLLTTQSAWAIYSVNPEDQSVVFLRYIFGNVVNIILDQEGPTKIDSILGALSQVLNLGMLVFTGFIIAYNALTGVLNSSRTGVVMGKAHSTLWIPLRMVISLFLVFPWSAGYSTLQVAVIWVAGQGIGLVNEGYRAALDFIASTGSLYPPIVQIKEEEIGLALLESRVCMHGVNYLDNQPNIIANPIELSKDGIIFDDSLNPNQVPIAERPPMRRIAQQFTSRASWAETKIAYAKSALNLHANGVPRYYGANACGEMVLEFGEVDSSSGVRDSIIAFQDEIVRAYAQLDSSLDPLAQSIVLAKFKEGSPAPDYTTLNSSVQAFRAEYEAAITELVSDIASARVSKWADGNPDQVGSTIGARDAGWISAGAWYWDIQRINAETQSLVSNDLKAEFKGPNDTVREHSDYQKIDEALKEYKENRTVIDSYTNAPKPALILASSSYATSPTFALLSTPIKFTIDAALAHPDPVTGAANIGHGIIFTFEVVYAAAVASSVLISGTNEMLKAKGSFAVFGTTIIRESMNYFISMLFFVGVLLLPIAMLLAFYLPAAPLVLWILGVAGWFVLLIEAVFAAPLWAASHAMPEGDGFVGQRAQAGYMVMLSLFLRPMLMLIGFFASMPLMIVMGKVLLFLFYPFMTSMLGDSISGILTFVGIMAVFTGLIIQIAHRCYGLIHEIPDKVLRFIGGGAENLGEAGSEQSTRQVFVAGAASVGRVKIPSPRNKEGAK